MPVVAQGCRTRAGATGGPVADTVMQPRSNIARVYNDNEMDPTTLKGAISAAQKARTLQTANAAAFLSATGESGRHKYAGQNVRIKSSSTSTGTDTKTGYITEKGLFKEWSDANLMTNSGKYGCPAATAITDLTGTGNNYSVPDSNNVKGSYAGTASGGKVNYGSYVGAPITNSNPTMFMGSKFAQTTWDGNDATLPACGNEGSNVQVVYPAKATGASYRGTYNAIKSDKSSTYMTKHDDISNPTYDSCKQRAEDVGHSVFGISSDKCYTAPSLDESSQGGIAYDVSNSKVVYSGPTPAKQLHFSMNGFLTLLKEPNDWETTKDVKGFPDKNISLYEIGRDHQSTIPKKCLYGYGGIMAERPTGTWGEGCNSIRIPYWRYQ
jgi:hypothetical protein